MIQQFSVVDLMAAIKHHVEDKTGLKCYDAVPKNAVSPFYFMEFVNTRPAHTKTSFRTDYEFYIHIIAEETDSSVPALGYLKRLDEAMTDDVIIPEPFWMDTQTSGGVISNTKDETGEKHIVTDWHFIIGHGWKIKGAI